MSVKKSGLAFGCEDFITDLRAFMIQNTKAYSRPYVAMAARANGVIPIDTVHINVRQFGGPGN